MDRVDYQSLVIQDLNNLHKADELDLSPWYQRRSVWAPAQKSYLINTIFEQKPIPALYIRHSLDLEKSKSVKEIVDGQQRTRTMLSYCNDEFSAKHPEHSNQSVKFSQLTKAQQQKFLLTSIPIGYLLGATDSDVIDIFGRINSVSKSLNGQEKRNAAYSGEMKQLCLRQASSRVSFWRNCNVFTANDIARMGEVQFVSDLIYSLINGLSSYSTANLDNMYKMYDESFPQMDVINNQLDFVFDFAASINPNKISDTVFNRQPIFFSLLYVIHTKQPLTIKKVEKAIIEIDERFNSDTNKSPEDIEFYTACSATTQGIASRRIRHSYILSFM
ncbi:DUF262 domain-containing protein [Sulfuricurvum sp. RIFCSPLOWO2_12_FULL_43_24]|uniref:DUF262 domain-containing protein n=1 Tax=Sulfuricurvum sp. RIFCSPLOWO2_12_FULL_43_24 TaxID=1802247 RepID=UPI0008B80914|nr:DUF262 domain-containing protein [Sulfuricurvum sp. RIFCSPLOWO2_12_FULL_43_24]OHD90958.1 MAG: hypothetical protein A3G19_02510 [Sulfuricurvum sp. RIFCSPLOWO2_12_FULL_43_24]